jgi:hypothetical protein
MIATAIITAPRPVETLSRSLASYRAAGFTNTVHVLSDGARAPLDDEDSMVIVNDPKLGNMRNWNMALRVIYDTEEPWLMVCEDDITWATGARAALERELEGIKLTSAFNKRAGSMSLYLPRRHTKTLTRRLDPGWHGYGLQRGRGTWGAQCFVFSREQARILLEDVEYRRFIADPARDKNIDAVVAHCVNLRGKEILYRVPCLVNHDLGDGNSSLGYKPDRPDLQTDYFTGAA